MSAEHNAVAILITKIQNNWMSFVHREPNLKMVRWLIKEEQARLFEGFLKIESSENGNIPEVFVVILTPFHNSKTFSKQLIIDFIKEYKTAKDVFEINNSPIENTPFNWNYKPFETSVKHTESNFDTVFKDMLVSFQKSLNDTKKRLVICFLPKVVATVSDYIFWFDKQLANHIPKNVLFTVFDYENERYFDAVFEKRSEQVKTLQIPLNMQSAMNSVSQAADPASPETQYRMLIQDMGKAVADKNNERLDTLGKKALQLAQHSGSKSFFASAHLVYAGMLFNYKKWLQINDLLNNASTLAAQGIQQGDDACKTIILQCHAYKAACKQQEGKDMEAADLYTKQADLAVKYAQPIQALTAWWQAAKLYYKKEPRKYDELLEKSYQTGKSLSKEALQNSTFGYVAYDYHERLKSLGRQDKCEQINSLMKTIDGAEWKTKVENFKNDSKAKKRFLLF